MTPLFQFGARGVVTLEGRFWVLEYDASMREGWQWCATHYPPFKTLEEARAEFIRRECGAEPPTWLMTSWQQRIEEALHAQAATAGP